ncbi:tetratricopeptide repeat protein [Alkalicaulis satelles]|nr:tetratricopeptide repeat protein [Alkalicaulis satelles]
MTLGEWLNRVILDDGPSSDSSQWDERLSAYPGFGGGGGGDEDDALREVIARLTHRLEAAEQRSQLALTGVDQSVLAISRRLEALEESRSEDESAFEDALSRTRARHDELMERLRRVEKAGPAGGADPAAVKAMETTLGKLAGRLYETERDVRAELDNLSHKDERRRESAERAAKALGARLDETEARLREDARTLREQIEAQTRQSGETLRHVEDAARRLQSRIITAENATHRAAEALAGSQQALDARLRALETRQGEALGADEINRRFEALGRELAAIIRETREDCARQIAKLDGESGGPARMERALEAAENRLAAAEARQSDALTRIAHEVSRLSRAVDRRIEAAERRLEHRFSETERARRAREDQTSLEARLDTVRTENTAAVRRMGEEMARLGETLAQRVHKAEQRSAEAVEAAGERMAQVVERMEQARASAPEADLDARIRASEERTAQRINDAMGGVYQRLDQARAETADALSPVQRAMTALAERLETIERKGVAQAAVPDAPVNRKGGGGGDDGGEGGGQEGGDGDPRPALRPAALARSEGHAFSVEADAPLPQAPGLSDAAAGEDDIALGSEEEPAGAAFWPEERPEPAPARAPEPAPVRREARIGATADAGFLAAARKTVRANRGASADWTPPAEPRESRRSRAVLVAASVLGFAAVAAAAGVLVLDVFGGGGNGAERADPSAALSSLFADAGGGAPLATAPAAPMIPLEGEGAAQVSAADDGPDAPALPEPVPVPRSAPVPADPAPAQSEPASERAAEAAPETSSEPAPEPAPEPMTLERAAAEGNAVARYQLALERLEAGALSDAAALMRRAAEQGEPDAMRRYAMMLQRGQGVDMDAAAARQWMVRAAEAGNVLAMFEAGGLFISAEETAENQAAAARWFQEAALHGNRDSQFNIALLFQEGFGVPQSLPDAYAWLRIAANAGDEDAASRASSLRRQLNADQRSAADEVAQNFTPRPSDPRAQGQYPRQPWQAAG